jgi:signal transduction histidine kinase
LLRIIFSFFLVSILYAAHPVDPTLSLTPNIAVRDAKSLIWIATDDALLRWDGHFLMQQDSWDNWIGGAPEAMASAPDGRFWAFRDGELFVHNERFLPQDLRSPILQARGTAIAFHDDVLFLATEKGLLRYSQQEGERVLLAGISVTTVLPQEDGSLVCGTRSNGLYRFDQQGNPESAGDRAHTLLPAVYGLANLSTDAILILGKRDNGSLAFAKWFKGSLVPTLFQGISTKNLNLPPTLISTPTGALAQTTTGWAQISHSMQVRNLLPARAARPEILPTWYPELLRMLPPPPIAGGQFQLQNSDFGVLVEREGEVVLAWQGDSKASSEQAHQIQVMAEGERVWILLGAAESDHGPRRIMSSDKSGFREWEVPAEILGEDVLRTICPMQSSSEKPRLLLGLSDQILLLEEEGVLSVSQSVGAHWMEPIAPGAVLVAGEHGVTLLEGETLSDLAIKEPCYRAIEDGYGGILACAKTYMLHLNSLNEVDTLAYPEALRMAPVAGAEVRQVVATESGRFWLLADKGLFYYSGRESLWSQPLHNRLKRMHAEVPGQAVFSLAMDQSKRLWLSTQDGTGFVAPDRDSPTAIFAEDPRTMDSSSPDRTLRLGAVDPLNPGEDLRWRVRLDDAVWSPWRSGFSLSIKDILPDDLAEGSHRLQLQAVDSWGNFSTPVFLPLHHISQTKRLPFAKRLILLLAMVGLSILATVFWPKRGGMYFSLLGGIGTGIWIFQRTDEPLFYWALPVIMFVASRLTTDQMRIRREQAGASEEPEHPNPLLELVDLFREFGHSGTATRNLDRLLRSSRNLYIDDEPDDEINKRFQEARLVFLELTQSQLFEIHTSISRLGPDERMITPVEQELFGDQVNEVVDFLTRIEDPPRRDALEELSFHLDRLEKTIGMLEHRVELQISSSPLKVLDLVLKARSDDLGGMQLMVDCPRDLKQVLVRLPVDRLQFILDNLVDNAAHWMKDSNSALLKFEIRERPRHLQLRVCDTGPGIPEEERERIFQAGVTARNERQTGVGGYGLYRSREILARFGGRLFVEESELGKGSTFLLEVKKVEPEGTL